MLDKNPANRPSASEVLRDEYIAEHLAVRQLSLAELNIQRVYFINDKSKLSFVPRVGEGVLPRIVGRGMPPNSSNPDPISDQSMLFFTPIFRPGLAGYKFSHCLCCSVIQLGISAI